METYGTIDISITYKGLRKGCEFKNVNITIDPPTPYKIKVN